VHALTDVTGFGLLGHLLEICRGSGLQAQLDWAAVPRLAQADALAAQGLITGASARNWASYGADVVQQAASDTVQRALLTDPQTSGGLLVACESAVVNDVLEIFRRHGFEHAAPVGRCAAAGVPRLVVA
jgi:selenide,water dikinase